MAGDITTTWDLEYRQFQNGVRRVLESAQTGQRQVNTELNRVNSAVSVATRALVNVAAVKKAYKIAQDAVNEYAKAYPELAGNVDATDKAAKNFMLSLGRDLSAVLGEGQGWLASMLDSLSSFREGLSNIGSDIGFIFGLTDASGDTKQRLREEQEAQIKRLADFRKFQREQASTNIALADANGDKSKAEALREQLRHQEKLQEIGQRSATSNEKAAARAMEAQVHAANMARIEREATKARTDRADKQEDELSKVEQEVRLAELKAKGRDKEAAALEVVFDYQARIRAVERDQTLTDQQRQQAIERLAASRGRAFAAVKEEQQRARDAEVRDINEAAQLDGRRARIDRLRIEGQATAADLAQLALETEAKIAEIMQNQSLTADEKARLVSQYRRDEEYTARAMERQAEEAERERRASADVRGLGSGLGSFASAVFGGSRITGQGGGGGGVAAAADAIARRQLTAVERIERAITGQGVVAVAG